MADCWVPIPDGSPFPLECLPYGVFVPPGTIGVDQARVGVAIGESIVDVAAVLRQDDPAVAVSFDRPALNRFLAMGPTVWAAVRERLTDLLTDSRQRHRVASSLVPLAGTRMLLPFTVADYVDFFSSEQHAVNMGKILRPDDDRPLQPNWKHLPVGYHGRSGTVVVSGTPVARPSGQRRPPGQEQPSYGPSARLDIEAEVGFVVGLPSTLGSQVRPADWRDHVFGVVLVNDWSARDIQAWEYQPLGPFLAKSFATSISPWVVPLAALEPSFVPAPRQDPEPLPHLRPAGPALDLRLEIALNGHPVSRPPFAGMYWTPAQQLAHLTSNGATLRAGDLFASGTVSGPAPDQRGSLMELSWNGQTPITLPDGDTRSFLADGDTVTISGWATGRNDTRIGLGAVTGTIHPAH
ncbi:MAG TPA: fumarylacetoacetase [Mycobacteriales bacterium]|nr:fumarylacetoacetase [Mycobacteriales bacterium]